MKLTSFGLSAVAFVAISLSLQAQTQATGTGAENSPATAPAQVNALPSTLNAPASAVSFAPRLFTGVRSELKDNINGGKANHVVGAFANPGFDLGYKAPKFNLGLSYDFE